MENKTVDNLAYNLNMDTPDKSDQSKFDTRYRPPRAVEGSMQGYNSTAIGIGSKEISPVERNKKMNMTMGATYLTTVANDKTTAAHSKNAANTKIVDQMSKTGTTDNS